MLLGLISSLVFRAARDVLKDDAKKQEKLVGSLLTALAIADVSVLLPHLGVNSSCQTLRSDIPVSSHCEQRLWCSTHSRYLLQISIGASYYGLPQQLKNPALWNPTTHGNISFTTFLFLTR